jgi:hypothetical protein
VYFDAQYRGHQPLFYEVESDKWHMAPMALVDCIRRLLAQGRSTDAAVDEYWRPSSGWRWNEAITSRCVVLSQVGRPADMIALGASHWRYSEDAKRARLMFEV